MKKKNKNYYYKIWLIIFIVIINFLMIIKNTKNYNKYKINSSSYFSCFIAMAKLENKYIRELIEYYKKLGLDKFFIFDDNSLNSEKISDVLQDYIDEGYVEILDVREKNFTKMYFFASSFDKYKSKCKWMLYFDIDEYLEFVDKKITINDYLSQDRFNKCEVIKINWVMYINDDLLYYDNRTLKERFQTPTYVKEDVRTVKSIVRNDSKRNPWIRKSGPHEPASGLYSCNSIGNYSPYHYGQLYPPILSYCYIKHYCYKSIEEYALKLKKGLSNGRKFDIDKMIKTYFERNNYSDAKLELFEKMLNKTFKWLHKQKFHKNNYKTYHKFS
jgi:hypothetical protein